MWIAYNLSRVLYVTTMSRTGPAVEPVLWGLQRKHPGAIQSKRNHANLFIHFYDHVQSMHLTSFYICKWFLWFSYIFELCKSVVIRFHVANDCFSKRKRRCSLWTLQFLWPNAEASVSTISILQLDAMIWSLRYRFYKWPLNDLWSLCLQRFRLISDVTKLGS